MLRVLDRHSAVDDDRFDADRKLMRLLVRRRVGDRLRIEDDQIREISFFDRPAIADLHLRGREACHLSNRLGQRQHALVAHVVAENPRERAVRARVRLAGAERTVRPNRRRVRPHAHPRIPHRGLHIVLGHHVEHRADAALVLNQQ